MILNYCGGGGILYWSNNMFRRESITVPDKNESQHNKDPLTRSKTVFPIIGPKIKFLKNFPIFFLANVFCSKRKIFANLQILAIFLIFKPLWFFENKTFAIFWNWTHKNRANIRSNVTIFERRKQVVNHFTLNCPAFAYCTVQGIHTLYCIWLGNQTCILLYLL